MPYFLALVLCVRICPLEEDGCWALVHAEQTHFMLALRTHGLFWYRSFPSMRIRRIRPVDGEDGGCALVLAEQTHFMLVLWTYSLLWHRLFPSMRKWHICLLNGPDGSCASVLAERAHIVSPLDVWSVLASVLPKCAQYARETRGSGVTGCKPAKAVVPVSSPCD